MRRHLTQSDLPQVVALNTLVFGPGRFARTAYRVREGTAPVTRFCRGAFDGDRLIASLRLTPIAIGTTRPHLLLGPLAVAPDFAGQGYGKALVGDCLDQARAEGIGIVTLIGDLGYYERFGFAPVPPGRIVFPGPADPRRILAVETTPGALAEAHGAVVALP